MTSMKDVLPIDIESLLLKGVIVVMIGYAIHFHLSSHYLYLQFKPNINRSGLVYGV
jgi:hypothetical protein